MSPSRLDRPPRPPTGSPLLRRLRRWWGGHGLAQALGLGAAILVLGLLAGNLVDSMRHLGMTPDLGYLSQPANFDISESPIAFQAGDTYGRAILVGLLNTLKLAVFGCLLSTLLGLALGLLRAAGNALLSRLVEGYVEIVRNTPLTLQLFFWIAATRMLPPVRQPLEPLPSVFLTVRGVYFPWLTLDHGALWPLAVLGAAALILIHGISRISQRASRPGEWVVLGGGFLAAVAGWCWGWDLRLVIDRPVIKGFNIEGGIALTPEFAAMLAGLSLYYAATVAEILRSGLQSVTHGQWEAGRALGLSRWRVLHLVALPQAMRVITPLITSSYLDLTKDTTLGVLIGFSEVTAVIKTSANNTGNAVETILVLVAAFLSISLPVSWAINTYNRRLAHRGSVAS